MTIHYGFLSMHPDFKQTNTKATFKKNTNFIAMFWAQFLGKESTLFSEIRGHERIVIEIVAFADKKESYNFTRSCWQ